MAARAAARVAADLAVDVGGFLQGASLARRGRSLHELSAALLNGGPGYFRAAGVEELLGDTARIYELSRQAHSLPVDVKRKCAGSEGSKIHGVVYSGSDAGKLELAYDPATKATARSWDYSRLRYRSPDAPGPAELAALDFEPVLDALYGRQNIVGAALLQATAEVLGLPASTFEEAFSSGDMGTIRLILYPGEAELRDEDTDVGISPHTDFEAFTLMHQDATGLQLLPAHDGGPGAQWVDAPAFGEGGEYVVIVGDVLERYTNGVLRATPHRVVRTRHSRRSIIRFNAVAPEAVIEPLAPFVTADRPRAYTRCTMQQHMDTVIKNLNLGLGSWCSATNTSLSARYQYEE